MRLFFAHKLGRLRHDSEQLTDNPKLPTLPGRKGQEKKLVNKKKCKE